MESASEILKKPYARVLVPEEDGSFRAEIMEFPGCIAVGDTAAEALSTLEEVAESWLEAVFEKGQPVPEPAEIVEYSGKVALRLPKSLHQRAAMVAKADGVSLNQFIVSSLASCVGAVRATRAVAPQAQNFFVINGNQQIAVISPPLGGRLVQPAPGALVSNATSGVFLTAGSDKEKVYG